MMFDPEDDENYREITDGDSAGSEEN
jgi:hypothetical protein